MAHTTNGTTTNRLDGHSATAQPKPPAPSAHGHGICLQCPLCGNFGEINFDMEDPSTLWCGECEAGFGPGRVRFYLDELYQRIDNWERVLGWLAAMPPESPDPEQPYEP